MVFSVSSFLTASTVSPYPDSEFYYKDHETDVEKATPDPEIHDHAYPLNVKPVA